MSWLPAVHAVVLSLTTAGILVDPHTCWRVVATPRSHPRPMSLLNNAPAFAWVKDVPGAPTLYHGCCRIERAFCSVLVARGEWFCIWSWDEFRQYMQGNGCPYPSMANVACLCSTKCALLTNEQLSESQLFHLDRSGYGSHILVGQTPALGLTLLGKWFQQDGVWLQSELSDSLRTQNPKAAAKVAHRVNLFANPGHSVIARSTGYSAYVISLVPYHTSYHGFGQHDIRWLQRQAVRLVLRRSWIQQQHLASIFRWLRITPLAEAAISLTVSVIGLYLRRGGNLSLLGVTEPMAALSRHDQIVREVWRSWFPLVGAAELIHLLSMLRGPRGLATRRFLDQVKKLLYASLRDQAVDYASVRIGNNGPLVASTSGG